ncbi:n-alpha-acetyltransferase 30 [Anaeramoeba flamelloides]|uniref:N-alpha-acetyltransferase n=1 Tax=Anaeramoeba flamelloides TaxID=1746091 RepID=A0AAV8A474_9EUKA|nr:n-alpha-acetyltransferase [Anaeramoeba flamelloides]KAJ6236013.1 n-alpha-acetyltransferase 30 [Anaeramoeba flamelloides]
MSETIDPKEIVYEQFKDESQMDRIMEIFAGVLSEPYSIFTYRHFTIDCGHLCFNAMHKGKIIGSIICKAKQHKKHFRGYIGMLAVDDEYRRKGIATTLVLKSIDAMKKIKCKQVVLETEIKNKSAQALYFRLGFVKTKRLDNYYLSGEGAYRLKVWL